MTRGRRNIRIVSGLETQEQALYIEQTLESHLRIEDAAVPGEITKHRPQA